MYHRMNFFILGVTIVLSLTSGCIIERYQRIYTRYQAIAHAPLTNGSSQYILADTLGVKITCSSGYLFEDDSLFFVIWLQVQNLSSQELTLDLSSLAVKSTNYSYTLLRSSLTWWSTNSSFSHLERANRQATIAISDSQEYHANLEYRAILPDKAPNELPANEEINLHFPGAHIGSVEIELASVAFTTRRDHKSQ